MFSAVLLNRVLFNRVLLAQEVEPPMMDDEASATVFVVSLAVLAGCAAVGLPFVLKRMSLKNTVPVLAFVGPVLAVIGSLLGSGAMKLSGYDVGYLVLVTALAGLAAVVVGWRVSRPLGTDLDKVATAVRAVAAGDRSARTNLDRSDELGEIGRAVDELASSLDRAEVERKAADAERRGVVSALSHDLRTPLASLLASVEAMEDGVADGPQHLRSMRSNVIALDHLVEDLFLLARADSGQLGLQSESIDLNEMIDEALEAVTPTAALKSVNLVADGHSAISVNADHKALGRLLRNLLDNAVRHSPTGGKVTVATKLDSSERVSVTITDEGPGFDPEFIPHAFDRFSQADIARSAHGGAGLGLAIAHTITTALGGEISIGSGPGGQVQFNLPLG